MAESEVNPAEELVKHTQAFTVALQNLGNHVYALEKDVRQHNSSLAAEVESLKESLENLAHNIQGAEDDESDNLDNDTPFENPSAQQAAARPLGSPSAEAEAESSSTDEREATDQIGPPPELSVGKSPVAGARSSKSAKAQSPLGSLARSPTRLIIGEYATKSERARRRWKWAVNQLKVQRMAKRISVIHARVSSSMTLGSRISRLEKRFDKIAYQLEVLKDSSAVDNKIAALEEKLAALAKKTDNMRDSMESQDSKIRELFDSRDTLLSDIESVLETQRESQEKLDALQASPDVMSDFKVLQESLKKFQSTQFFISGKLEKHENGVDFLDPIRDVDDHIRQVLAIQDAESLAEAVRLVETLTRRLANLQEVVSRQASLFTGMDWNDLDNTHFEKKIEWILSEIAKFLACHGDHGMVHVQTLQIMERLRSFVNAATVASLKEEILQLQEVQEDVRKVKAKLDERATKQEMQEMLDQRVREATELAKLEIMRDMRFELTEALRDIPREVPNVQDNENINDELNSATKKIEDLRNALFGKVEIKDLDSAIASLQTQIKKVATESARKEQFDLLARDKVGKGELEKLAEAFGSFGSDDDDPVIASRKKFTCLSCNRPLPNLGKPSLALPENTGRPEVVPRTASPPPSASPVYQNAPKTLELPGNTAQYALDPVFTEDGPVVSRYPRVMPPKMRVQVAAGGLGNARTSSRFAATR